MASTSGKGSDRAQDLRRRRDEAQQRGDTAEVQRLEQELAAAEAEQQGQSGSQSQR